MRRQRRKVGGVGETKMSPMGDICRCEIISHSSVLVNENVANAYAEVLAPLFKDREIGAVNFPTNPTRNYRVIKPRLSLNIHEVDLVSAAEFLCG